MSSGLPQGWEEKRLGDLLTLKYGKDHKKLNDSDIPVYGSGGIMRYVDTSIYEKESILIPRKGTLSNIFYINKPFWTVDTIFWSMINLCKQSFSYFLNNIKRVKNKPKIFWHVITREKTVRVRRGRTWQIKKIRKFDKNRAKRIRWIKHLIHNFDDTDNNIFSFFYRETKGQNRGKLRLYIWAKEYDYIVIIEKLNRNSSFIVTAFFIDEHYKKSTYQKRYEESCDLSFGLATWI